MEFSGFEIVMHIRKRITDKYNHKYINYSKIHFLFSFQVRIAKSTSEKATQKMDSHQNIKVFLKSYPSSWTKGSLPMLVLSRFESGLVVEIKLF